MKINRRKLLKVREEKKSFYTKERKVMRNFFIPNS